MAVPLIALEIVLGFGVPVAWGVWELLSLRRERRKDAEKAATAMLLAQGAAPTDTHDPPGTPSPPSPPA